LNYRSLAAILRALSAEVESRGGKAPRFVDPKLESEDRSSAMATRALTPVAQRQSRANVSAKEAPGRERDWRQVFLSQDAQAIWHQLSVLVSTVVPGHSADHDLLTQELFLNLLATDRINYYIEHDYSDAEIRSDLIEFLSG
jgi:hypothetical protein